MNKQPKRVYAGNTTMVVSYEQFLEVLNYINTFGCDKVCLFTSYPVVMVNNNHNGIIYRCRKELIELIHNDPRFKRKHL